MSNVSAGVDVRAVRLAWAASVLAVVVVAYTGLSLVSPLLRLAVPSSGTRVVIEVVGVCALLFAALAMSLPGERDLPAARDGLIAALLVLALANAVFGVGPYAWRARLPGDQGLAYYPWIAARYLAGLLFIAAAIQRPRLGLGLTLAWALLLFVSVEVALIAFGDRLAVPLVLSGVGPTIEVVAPVTHLVLQSGPALLFGVGSWLAGRLYRTTGAIVLMWVSLALMLQLFAQIHEILYPAMLGPVVTSADMLRLGAFALLLVGAVLQLRRLYVTRSRTVRLQERDMEDQARLVDELGVFAEKEALFRSIVSHELATPIATIRNYTELIAARMPKPCPADLRAALDDMRGEAERLLELVGRIDELRDLEHEQLRCELRAVRVLPLLSEARRFLDGLDSTHPVNVDCEDVRVLADPVRLGQLLRNLLVNAVRFSPPATGIELVGCRVDDRFELRVRDRGPGIPAHERSLVLRRSVRGGNAVGTEGLGLGLYLAHQIADGHGGSLSLRAGPDGAGTEVLVRLQVAT